MFSRKRSGTAAGAEARKAAEREAVRRHLAGVDAARARKAADDARAATAPETVPADQSLRVRMVPKRVALAGTTKYQVSIARALVAEWGDAAMREWDENPIKLLVTMTLDPHNPYDEDAVKVTAHGQTLGYIPREHTAWARTALGAPTRNSAEVGALIVVYDNGDDDRSLGVIIPQQP